MRRRDVICPGCSAGYRRIELVSEPGKLGCYCCLVCDRILEVFDGSREVAYRLTVQPILPHADDQLAYNSQRVG
jgi:hypothetical protein